jgi:predicted transcriptional regulator
VSAKQLPKARASMEKTAWAGPLIYKTVEVIDHVATGESMRQLRKSHKISLREVARRMKLSAPFISDLERGNRNWDGSRSLAFMSAVTSGQIARIHEAQSHNHQKDFRIGIRVPRRALQNELAKKNP